MYCEWDGIAYAGEPQNLSEFGGVSFGGRRIEQTQCVQKEVAWGYDSVSDEDSFVQNYERTIRMLLACEQLSGFCYTQLYDVEQEENGLLTYARGAKFSEDGMRRIREANRMPAAIEASQK